MLLSEIFQLIIITSAIKKNKYFVFSEQPTFDFYIEKCSRLILLMLLCFLKCKCDTLSYSPSDPVCIAVLVTWLKKAT